MKKALLFFLSTAMLMTLTACGNTQTETSVSATAATTAATEAAQPQTTAPVGNEAPQENPQQTEQPKEVQNMTLQMTIGDTPVSVAWEDNEAVQALKALCENQPLTIDMSMYGGFEQVGSIGSDLPANDMQTTTSAGDIVLYSGNRMVVFYGSNTWAYTRLGHISDKSEEEMTQLLSNGNITITLTYREEKQ